MSACEDIRELFDGRIDGELTAAEAARLEEHLASCEACREELAELERVWRALGVLAEVEVPEDLAERVLSRVRSAQRGVRRRGRVYRWAYPLAAAAALLVAVTVGHFLTTDGTIDPETRQIVKEMDLLQNLEVLENLDVLQEMGDGVLLLSVESQNGSTNGSGS